MTLIKGKSVKSVGIFFLFALVLLSCAPRNSAGRLEAPNATESVIETPLASDEQELSSVEATGESNEVAAPVDGPVSPPVPTPTQGLDLGSKASPSQSTSESIGKVKTVAIDPGHGGSEVGAAQTLPNGTIIREKEVNLKIALRLRDLLLANGYRVVLTRETDGPASGLSAEPPVGYSRTRADLQARVDIANNAHADLFISIHNNGSADPQQSGTEVWYCKDRPFADANFVLAQLVLESLVSEIRATGYNVRNRGMKEDANFRIWQGRSYHLFVLGPPRTEPMITRAAQMPGILVETLFISNPTEAALLAREEVLDAIARGYYQGIVAYFEQLEGS